MDLPLLDYFKDPDTPLGILDLVYALIILYGLLRGLFRGFAKETASILGTILTFWGSWHYHPAVSRRLLSNNLLDSEPASQILAYLLLLLLFFAVWRLVTVLLHKLLLGTLPEQIQRPGGALLGALKALLLLTILLIAVQLSRIEPLQKPLINDSALGRLIRDHLPLDLPTPAPTNPPAPANPAPTPDSPGA